MWKPINSDFPSRRVYQVISGSRTLSFPFLDIGIWHREMIYFAIFNRIAAVGSVQQMPYEGDVKKKKQKKRKSVAAKVT